MTQVHSYYSAALICSRIYEYKRYVYPYIHIHINVNTTYYY